jgi:hypothetical protein
MKIRVQNLGPIDDATLVLRPLTILVGPSNTGKTWTASTVANALGLFGFGWLEYLEEFTEQKSEHYPPIEQVIAVLETEGHAQIDLATFANEFGQTYFNAIARLAPRWLSPVIGARSALFEKTRLTIDLEATDAFWSRVNDFRVRDQVGGILRALKEKGETLLYFYVDGQLSDLRQKLPLPIIREFIARNVFASLHHCSYGLIWPFPVERTGVLSLVEQAGAVLKSLPGYDMGSQSYSAFAKSSKSNIVRSYPVTIYQSWMAAALWQATTWQREQDKAAVPQIDRYIQLAEILEQHILGGKVDFSTNDPGVERKIHFTIPQTSLEVTAASSSVKELAPLVICLRYLVKPGDLLFIDEPEMNLHPQAQARLMEFLVMLVNAGLNVLFTTHSPYLVDHLVNLTTAAQHSNPQAIVDLFYLKRQEAFIVKDKVSVYLFENGTARSILEEDGMIDWETFSVVSDHVSQIYYDLTE